MSRPSAAPGFSLVEVALSLAILAVGMTGVLALLPIGLDSARQVHAETIASTLVRSAIGSFSTNGLSPAGFAAVSRPSLGDTLTNQIFDPEGALLPSTETNRAAFALDYVKGSSDATSCRYFLNLYWPYRAWALNTNNPTSNPRVQRRTFVVDVVKNF